MDPFSLIIGATALYNTIKSAVDAGHDVMETADKISDLFTHVGHIVAATSEPRKKKLFQSQTEFEAEAVKLYSIKAKAKEMQFEVQNMFVAKYGRPAWDAIQREVIEMRKDAARQVAEEEKHKKEVQDDLVMVGTIIGCLVIGIGVIGVILMVTVK